ncbi:MAG: type II secretion system minor pseudopilin GspJ [Alphaproteobacteria bacterium]|nr:type II secretion system minor pseudopilin GspJ [Alphaproteobacteria bacterium]
MSKQAGFSLLEILVATFVFSLVTAIAVSLMVATMTAQEVNEDALERSAGLDRLRVVLREDFGQIANRSLRDEGGYTRRYSFAGDSDGLVLPGGGETDELLLSFARHGRANPGQIRPRSSLIYVEYFLDDGALIRRTRDYPDLADTTLTSEETLFDRLEDVELAFLIGSIWVASYQAVAEAGGANQPLAVRLRYTHPAFGEMEHIVATGEGLNR